ncbi:hypothetical protein NLJ89_g3917 [Agrocybe chaxingu]|uniref:Uncharacterized protein n=1 Tax=Agrocybe chaxingu TaxID=84603 RepID=A0A9W8K1J8_9AGAR|nr:hypothetical protein NLJ89_g3917 [Agrocybe chaxingu]
MRSQTIITSKSTGGLSRGNNSSVSSSASLSSLKRSRSPGAQVVKRSSTPKKSAVVNSFKTPERRKNKFDTDSEGEAPNGIIHVRSTVRLFEFLTSGMNSLLFQQPNPQQRKKARLSSPIESSESTATELVPSSQSDEEELASTAAQTNGHSIVLSRPKQVLPPTPDQDDGESMCMDVDVPITIASPPDTPSTSKQPAREGSRTFDQIITPPPSDLPSMPPTPVALDQATKTAQIIADIKARAYAKNLSSPEPAPLEFNETLDSSDDDLEPLELFAQPKHKAPSTSSGKTATTTMERRTTRYSLRNRSSSPTQGSRRQPLHQAVQAKTRKSTADPFEALLREKRLADKRGKGDNAIHRANETALKLGKTVLIDEMDDEEDEDDILNNWTGSDISSLAMRQLKQSGSQFIDIKSEDRKKLFGEDGGKEIMGILERDRAATQQPGPLEKIPGIQLWAATSLESRDMVVDGLDTRYEISGESPIIQLLNSSLKRGDIIRVTMLLNTKFMLTVPTTERVDVASSLCGIVLSTRYDIAEPAARTLDDFWASTAYPITSTIAFAQILACLQSVGADPAILKSLRWTAQEGPDAAVVDPTQRGDVIRRLITLTISCARTRRLRVEEIPDIVLALMLIGMDLKATPELSRDVSQAINEVCQCMPSDKSSRIQAELALCTKVLDCIMSYQPINKLRMLSFLSDGSGSARRVANFVAYCIIVDQNSPATEIHSDIPPLDKILDELTAHSQAISSPARKFALRGDTDYVDLGFYISILSIAVSNLKAYVTLELETTKRRPSIQQESPTKSGEKPKTELQLLHITLEKLHSRISDSRAAHLDRSRTKANIKGLAMNVHYQREIWRRNASGSRPKTLAQFFGKGP